MAVPTGIEPAISCVTGRRDNRYTTGPNSYSQCIISNGDPYGIRTRVTAVKGRCLNHLTNGPKNGSTGRTRTCDPLINSQMLLPTELLWINICVPNEQYLLYKSINIMSILLYNFFYFFQFYNIIYVINVDFSHFIATFLYPISI